MTASRRQRANGVASRRKIIEAALDIASERGYEGTSIAAVSERSGLPASSIYWHFANKDVLIAAVIEHSFEQWHTAQAIPPADEERPDPRESLVASMRRAGAAIADAPDFLRLGLMLALERRPEEPAARSRFLDIRRSTLAELQTYHRRIFEADLDDDQIRLLSRLAMAIADGLFISSESFELAGVVVAAAADHLRSDAQTTPTRRRAKK
jgi:AcrR family transcriptional regulator